MRFTVNKTFLALTLIMFCMIQCEFAASYKTEVEITPSPLDEETTTKKSGGFFGGFKSFFRGGSTTTIAPIIEVTTPKNVPTPAPQVPKKPEFAAVPNQPTIGQKPPPLIIPNVPLMPLGPRPDTPPSSPLGGNQQQQPQWPQAGAAAAGVSTTTTARPTNQQQIPQRPQVPPPNAQLPQNPQYTGGATPFGGAQRPGSQPSSYRPQRPQPSGLDLSYGGGAAGGRPQNGGHSGAGLAPLSHPTTSTTTSTTTTTTTTRRPQTPIDDFPALPAPRRPSVGAKEDFPALTTPKSPVPTTPIALNKPSSPSAWGAPTPAWPSSTTTTAKPGAAAALPTRPSSPTPGGGGFVPRAPGSVTTTTRPGAAGTGNSVATDDEIRALTETLYTKETANLYSSVTVNLQGKTRSIDSGDEAPKPLLEVDPKVFENPTVAKMRLLLNNYDQDTKVNEHVTPNERKEENDFLDAVMATPVMRQAMLFLQNKGIVTPDPKTHRDLVKELWFTQYSRGGGKIGSSGFEHVFVNEVKDGTIIGLHNWIYFADEESAGRLDYKGYMNALDLGTKGKVVKARFTHNGLNKPVNSLFVGTSPELELALYTVCHQLRPDRSCPISMANNRFSMNVYSWRYRGKSLIGSAYPEI